MGYSSTTLCTAFHGTHRIAAGAIEEVALRSKEFLDHNQHATVLIFDDRTSEAIEIDFRGTPEDVIQRLATARPTPAPAPTRGPGRPKLGVVAREVTLLPRHWDWLNRQPGGASVALRKLVEEARRIHKGRDEVRQSQEAAYRFMSAMAGNEPHFEEAIRALYAQEEERFDQMVAGWPPDIRDYAKTLATPALHARAGEGDADPTARQH